ncbi:MAG: PhoU domain-containing protein [Candidatus Marinimicrobia bacterium]|nr:PhoU domain-containing protein [Candidatus Neomarinimicrobiota bacterium]
MFNKGGENSFWKELGHKFRSKGLLDKSWELLIEMIRFDQEMFSDAYHILRKEYSEEKIFALREKDKRVNFMHVSVRENIETHLLLSQKYRNDLPFALGIATVVNHLERIGDNCKNIADIALIYKKMMEFGELDKIVADKEDKVLKHFAMLKEAFINKDEKICKQIMSEYKTEISGPIDEQLKKIVHGDYSDLSQVKAIVVSMYLRYLKRIDANQKNVATIMVNPFTQLGYKNMENENE